MTGWIIFGSIVLVLVLIFIQSAVVTIVYDKNPDLPMLEVKFMFFTLFRYPAPPKKKRAGKPKRVKAEKPPPVKAGNDSTKADDRSGDDNDTLFAEQDEPDKKDKSSKKGKKGGMGFDLEMITDYIRSAAPPVRRLFKKIRVRDLYIDWVTASDDAAKTAIKYGAICSAVYSTTKFLTTYFDVKPKEINIEADFASEKDDIFVYCTVKLRLCTALACAIWLLARVVRTYLKYCRAGKKPSPKKQKA